MRPKFFYLRGGETNVVEEPRETYAMLVRSIGEDAEFSLKINNDYIVHKNPIENKDRWMISLKYNLNTGDTINFEGSDCELYVYLKDEDAA